MIEIGLAKSNCLAIDVKQASLKARMAAQSCLTSRYSKVKQAFLISMEDFSHFDTLLQELGAPDDGNMTPEAQEAYSKFCEEQEAFLALKTKEPDWSIWEKLQQNGAKTKPYSDQLQCIAFHVARGRSLEASETGVGKTLSVLFTYLYWKSMGVADKGLILCVNSGKLDWEKEVLQHTSLTPVLVGNGSRVVYDDVERFIKSDADLLIAHYDAILPSKKKTADVLSIVKTIPFGFIGLDECHTLKNPTTVRHKTVMDLLSGLPEAKVVSATGTAIDGNPKSAWVPLKIASNGGYLPSYTQFIRHFITWEEKYFGKRKIWVETGFKNLGQLKDRLAPVSIRFMKSQVLDRPSKIFQTRLVKMTGSQEAIYREIRDKVIQEIQEEGKDQLPMMVAATKLLRLRQVAHHPLLLDGVVHFTGDSAKYLELDDVAEEILSNPDAQMLVWTQWRAGVERLVKRYKQYGAIAFYGGSDDRVIRDQVLSKKARMIVAIPEKAGTSIDWLKVCRTAVYLEKPFNLALYRQSMDRIDRRSNTDAALIITIQALGSVDIIVEAALQKKQSLFDVLTVDDAHLVSLGKAELLQMLKL